jgi:hypothetical protein
VSFSGLTPVGIAIGPGAIVAIGVLIGITAGIMLASYEDAQKRLQQLSDTYEYTKTHAPDLRNMAQQPQGLYKLNLAFVDTTLPDFPSSAVLPQRQAANPQFMVGLGASAQPSTTVSYKDSDGVTWTATPWASWFEQTAQVDGKTYSSITPTLRITDHGGKQWFASRIGNSSFLLSQVNAVSGLPACPADAKTGITSSFPTSSTEPYGFATTGDRALCSSYVARSFPMVSATGSKDWVALSIPTRFTSPSTAYFKFGTASTFQITAQADTAPAITATSSLPAGFSISTGSGSVTLSYNGGGARGTYTITLSAICQNVLSIRTTQALQITVGDFIPTLGADGTTRFLTSGPPTFPYPSIDGTVGYPMSFHIVTNVVPYPKFTMSFVPAGLTFRDNGDGTADLTGTPVSDPVFSDVAFSYIMSAENDYGIDLLIVNIHVADFGSVTFTAGVPNQWNGSVTPTPGPFDNGGLAWLSFRDNGNGTGVIGGTPPPGTAGSFALHANHARGTITVINPPLFTSSAATAFMPDRSSEFRITTSRLSGKISYTGVLPDGLTFTDQGNGTAMLSGQPNAASGVFPLTLTWDDGIQQVNAKLDVYVVRPPDAMTSSAMVVFTEGLPQSFNIITSGFPTAWPKTLACPDGQTCGDLEIYRASGSDPLPAGLTLSDAKGAGAGVISGTPAAGSAGQYRQVIRARNGLRFGSTNADGFSYFDLKIIVVPAVSVGNTIRSSGAGPLEENQRLTSPGGRFRAAMQSDGNFVVYDQTRPVWASNTYQQGDQPYQLYMQSDGNLVLYAWNKECPSPYACAPTWASQTQGKGTGPYTLTMQDDGNLVIYDGSHNATWATGTNLFRNVLLSGGSPLLAGQSLTSPNQRFRATMLTNGDFALYDGVLAIWETGIDVHSPRTRSKCKMMATWSSTTKSESRPGPVTRWAKA